MGRKTRFGTEVSWLTRLCDGYIAGSEALGGACVDKRTLERLHAAAQAGEATAQQSLAEFLASAGLAPEARAWIGRAANIGLPEAAVRLGLWELAGFGGPPDPAAGLARIRQVAAAGMADAVHVLAMLHAGGIGVARDIPEALRLLVSAALKGHEAAIAQVRLLAGDRWPIASSSVDPGAVARSLELGWYYRPIERKVELESPRIETLPGFLPGWLCDYVMRRAGPALERGKVVDDSGGESVDEVRSNRVMNFGLADSDVLLELVNLRVAAAVEMPPEHGEGLGVLHYQPGETYAPHVDFIPATPANAAQLAERGQRTRTLLVYLNEDFDGGETDFPILQRRFRPPRGSALVFHSVDEQGRTDQRTVHAGRSPVSGDKWVISKWFRTKPLRPGPPA